MCCATLWPDKGGRRLMSRFLCNTAGSLSGWQFRSTGDSRLSGFPADRVGWRERGGADLDRLRIIPVRFFRVPGRRRRPPASCSSPVCVSAFLPFSSFFPVPSGAFQMRSYFVPMVFLLISGGSSGRSSTGVISAGWRMCRTGGVCTGRFRESGSVVLQSWWRQGRSYRVRAIPVVHS